MTVTSAALETTDTEVAWSFLLDAYGRADLESHDPDFSFAVASIGDERMSALHHRWRGAGRVQTDNERVALFVEIVDGAYSVTRGRDAVDTSRPFLLPQAVCSAVWDDRWEVEVLQLDMTAVTDHVRRTQRKTMPFAFTGTSPIPAMAAVWRATSRYAYRDVLTVIDVATNPLIRAQTFDLLVGVALQAFPNTTMGVAVPVSGGTAAYRRAVAYLEEHAAEPITVLDVAEAARMTPRGLQALFRRIEGRSPLTHLRRLRLDGVRQALLDADPGSGDSVAAIARRWGFVHLGRFAGYYRDEFGELPAETLRR